MKRSGKIGVAFGCAALIVALVEPAQGAVSVGLPTIDRSFATVDVRQKAVVTSSIVDDQGRRLRVRVERADANGEWRRAGGLRDGGRDADLERGDGVYSGRVRIPTDATGQVRFRLAVTPKGEKTRVYSEEFMVEVVGDDVPTEVSSGETVPPVTEPATGADVLCDEVFVFFRIGTQIADMQRAIAQVGVAIGTLNRHTWQVRIPCSGDFTGVQSALSTLMNDPVVDFAEPTYLGSLGAVDPPNDLHFPDQTHLDTMEIREAWEVTRDGATVAVVDSGVNYLHEDIGRVRLGRDFVGLFHDDDPMPVLGTIKASHGTKVAGIIAARTGNWVGVAGIATSQLFVTRVCCGVVLTARDDTLAEGIYEAVDKGVLIINVSYAGIDSQKLKDAVIYALAHKAVVVASAGNNNCNTRVYPAAYTGVIAVGALGEANEHAVWEEGQQQCSFETGSNFGDWVTLYAPGTNVWSTSLNLFPGGNNAYDVSSGTSLAAPHVSGVVSLMRGVNSALTPAQILTIIRNTATDTGNRTPDNRPVQRLNARAEVCAARPSPAVCGGACPCTQPTLNLVADGAVLRNTSGQDVSAPSVGTPVRFVGKYSVTGTGSTGLFVLRFLIDGQEFERQTLTATGGQSYERASSATWTVTGGDHVLRLELDVANAVPETFETDNYRIFIWTPGTSCSNQCSPVGDMRCVSSTQETCDDYNSDGCLEWGAGVFCPNGCSGNSCASGSACTPNQQQSCYSGPGGTEGVGICRGGTQTCNAQGTAWGPCVGEVLQQSESCNGLDDDCNAIMDDPFGCWREIYRLQTNAVPLASRCLNVTTAPTTGWCSTPNGYNYERVAFVVATSPVPGTYRAVQCSFMTDHIVVEFGSADYNTLIGQNRDCTLELGYIYRPGQGPPSGSTPWSQTCDLWRFAYTESGSGLGAHLFTAGPDLTTGLTCEPVGAPAPVGRVFNNNGFSCFSGRPPGCN